MVRRSARIDTISPVDVSQLNRAEKQESTRSYIAITFVGGYLIIIVGLITLSTFFKLQSDTAKDYLLAVGSPLGFIIGFYFKTAGEDR